METRRLRHSLAFHAAWILFAFYVLRNAWVSEDAYITLRVIDNFFNGHGLRWNINERVQVYTHPLWLLLHLPLRAMFSNLFLISIFLSLSCTVAAVLTTLSTVRKPLIMTLGIFFLPLLASKSFMDYTTSGLESPLLYLLFALFGYVMVKKSDHKYFWFYCSLTVGLSVFTRLDTAILFVPTLAWLTVTRFFEIRWRQVAIGALPLVGWLCFALFYYGFLLPNTKYAKLDTEVNAILYISNGLKYAKYLLIMDTASVLEILSSLTFILLAMRKNPPVLHRLHQLPLCIALGIFLYSLYIVNIGGDYMIGRFWASPVFASIWLFYVFLPTTLNRKILYAVIGMLALFVVSSPITRAIRDLCPTCDDTSRMIDAKSIFGGNALVEKLNPLQFNAEAHHRFADWGKDLANANKFQVKRVHFAGMVGYYAGPNNILIDELGLADPLLSRLPVRQNGLFFAGHFRRNIPEGYLEAVETGSTKKMDPSLAMYYEKLRLITSGDLLDSERLMTIIAFNLGEYDHWKQDYLLCNDW